jgi:hypothetical protein
MRWFKRNVDPLQAEFQRYASSSSPVDVLVAQLSVLVGEANLLCAYTGVPTNYKMSFSTNCTILQLTDGRVLVLGSRKDTSTWLALTDMSRVSSCGKERELTHTGSAVKRYHSLYERERSMPYSRYDLPPQWEYPEWTSSGMDDVPGVTEKHVRFILESFQQARNADAQDKATKAILKLVQENTRILEKNTEVRYIGNGTL